MTLGSMRWIALLAVLGSLFARGVGPSLRGVAVGWDRFTNRAENVVEIVTQLTAVILLTAAVALVVDVARSRAPIYLRATSIVLTGAVGFLLFSSIQAERPFSPVLVALSFASSTLAIATGVDALKQPAAGSLGGVAVLTGVANYTRTIAVLLANRAALLPHTDGIEGSRVVATVSFGAQILLLVLATAWITLRSKKVASPIIVVALALAALATRQALGESDAAPLHFIVKHGLGRLLPSPVPFVPHVVELFVGAFGPLLALAVLAMRRQVPALLGSLALLLVAGASSEIPILSAAVVVASLSLTLASRDARGVWAAIAAAERSRS